MKCRIGKYIVVPVIMAEANCLNTEKKVSHMVLKQDSSSELKIQEILYKGYLAILFCSCKRKFPPLPLFQCHPKIECYTSTNFVYYCIKSCISRARNRVRPYYFKNVWKTVIMNHILNSDDKSSLQKFDSRLKIPLW